MYYFPTLRQLTDRASLAQYASSYEQCSGLPIPTDYLHSTSNRIFGIYFQGELIGGFLLGNHPDYRTLACFAQADNQAGLLERMGGSGHHTEICCFFIQPAYRTHTGLNLAVWLWLTYGIRRYGRRHLLFGTNSASLARLYGQTHRSEPFHHDRIEGKRTFLFIASRRRSVQGMLEIIWHKLKRQRRIKKNLSQPRPQAAPRH